MTGRILRKNKRCVKVKHWVTARLTSGGLPKLISWHPVPVLLGPLRPARCSRLAAWPLSLVAGLVVYPAGCAAMKGNRPSPDWKAE